MKYATFSLVLAGMLSATQAWAVPVLQVGAPGGPGEGTYADYQGSTSNPTEDDTAITSGGTLYVSGLFAQNDVLNLGGQYTGGLDWSELQYGSGNNAPYFPGVFDDKGAILVVSLPETFLASAASILKVDGILAFLSDTSESYFPNNHAPTNDSASGYLFFDIGDFSESVLVPDFADESAGSKLGEIKTLLLSGFDDLTLGLPWAHFDVMALETTQGNTSLVTTIQNNPGSHDVTWKTDGGGGPPQQVPEPAMLFLMGAGLLGLGLARRGKSA